jgi:hypothetical protein
MAAASTKFPNEYAIHASSAVVSLLLFVATYRQINVYFRQELLAPSDAFSWLGFPRARRKPVGLGNPCSIR